MQRLQWAPGHDAAHAALVIAGIAIALGGASLFGIVAHTKTPFLQRFGTSPPDWAPPPDNWASRKSEARQARHVVPEPVVAAAPVAPQQNVEPVVAPAPAAQASPVAQSDESIGLASLTHGESVVLLPKPSESLQKRLDDMKPIEAPPVEMNVPERTLLGRPAVIRVADVRTVATKEGRPASTEVKVVDAASIEKKAVKAKPPEPKRKEPPVTVARAPAAKPQPRPAAAKVAEVKRIEPKRAEVKRPEVKHPEAKRADARMVEVKKADVKAAEARRMAQAKLAENKAAQARLAEARRAADAKLVQARLAEAKRAGEIQAAEKLAEAQHAAQIKAAEAKLVETQRSIEATLAEAKLAQAKLAETRRSVEVPAARPAVDTRYYESRLVKPTTPSYASCESCGTVTSVASPYLDRRQSGWEVRVNFGGSTRIFVYPTDPGFASGERVRLASGRLMRM